MRAGELDRQIVINRLAPNQNSFGEEEKEYLKVATVWASVKPVKSSEKFTESQTDAVLELEFKIRYRSDIEAKMQIVYNGKNFDIKPPMEIGRREGLRIIGTAKV